MQGFPRFGKVLFEELPDFCWIEPLILSGQPGKRVGRQESFGGLRRQRFSLGQCRGDLGFGLGVMRGVGGVGRTGGMDQPE